MTAGGVAASEWIVRSEDADDGPPGAIVHDIAARGYRQPMAIMDAVWPITALYWGPVAAWAYFRRGRRESLAGCASTGRTA